MISFKEYLAENNKACSMSEEHAGDICSCCGNKIKEDGTCGCDSSCEHCGGHHDLTEATYQGREVKLNKPMAGDVKKSKVYVKDPETGNVKKVEFGDPNMTIKKSNPARRKSFRARHGCDDPSVPKPKTKARYWSCKAW